MTPQNQQDYSELPLPYETDPRFLLVLPGHVRFVFLTSLANAFYVRTLRLEKFLAFWKALFGRIYRSEKLWFFTKRWSKDIGILWNFEIYLFFRLSSGIETFLCRLILNDCVASGSLQQRTWRWDKRPMHLFDGITLALKQWMVWMRPFGTLVSDTSLVHFS